ncbi:acyltransferase [Candidatus Pacearchaeota archaeon]|nr:acyltransferase [Candidatus Pacearchaeota archaeon]
MLKELSCCNKGVFFHGIEVPEHSWYKVSNFYRTSFNAGIIELCKSIPYFPELDIKNNLLRLIGVNLGKDVTIAPRVQFDYFYPELISVDDNTLIGDCARLWAHEYGIDYFAVGEVKIGKNVYVGTEALIGPGEIKDDSNIKARAIMIYEKDFS